MLGPRIGRYDKKTKQDFVPHSFPLATLGMFLLFFGWFGFNGGSVLSADPGLVSFVFVTTILGGLAGTLTSMITSWSLYKRPDLTNVLNGSLAGLVSITAGADVLTPLTAVIVGAIGGIIVVFSADFFNHLKIDDPVGQYQCI
jgi:Amt family ammonium transporter